MHQFEKNYWKTDYFYVSAQENNFNCKFEQSTNKYRLHFPVEFIHRVHRNENLGALLGALPLW